MREHRSGSVAAAGLQRFLAVCKRCYWPGCSRSSSGEREGLGGADDAERTGCPAESWLWPNRSRATVERK